MHEGYIHISLSGQRMSGSLGTPESIVKDSESQDRFSTMQRIVRIMSIVIFGTFISFISVMLLYSCENTYIVTATNSVDEAIEMKSFVTNIESNFNCPGFKGGYIEKSIHNSDLTGLKSLSKYEYNYVIFVESKEDYIQVYTNDTDKFNSIVYYNNIGYNKGFFVTKKIDTLDVFFNYDRKEICTMKMWPSSPPQMSSIPPTTRVAS